MAEFMTGAVARERLRGWADQVDAAYAQMRALSCDEVGSAFRVELAERLKTQQRINRGLMYAVFGQLAEPPAEAAMAPAMVNTRATDFFFNPA